MRMSTRRRKGLVVLLGAGASADADLPVSAELLKGFIAFITGSPTRSPLPQHLAGQEPWYPIPPTTTSGELITKVRSLCADTVRPVRHIEELLARIWEQAQDDLKTARAPTEERPDGGPWGTETLYRLAERLVRRFIYWRLQTPLLQKCSYLSNIATLCGTDTKIPLTIATLNWDCALERALKSCRIAFSTGFWQGGCQRIRRWVPESLDANLIRVLKLHGSLSWIRRPGEHHGGIVISSHNPLTQTEMNDILFITPLVREIDIWRYEAYYRPIRVAGQRAPLFHPMSMDRGVVVGPPERKGRLISWGNKIMTELWKRFGMAIEQARALVILGYSGTDEHVNAVLKSQANSRCNVVKFKRSTCPCCVGVREALVYPDSCFRREIRLAIK